VTELRASLSERPIPTVTAGPIAEEHEPVVLWVHSGTATVETPTAAYRLAAGEAIWIPRGVVHRTRTDQGGVVFPIFPRRGELRGALAAARVFVVPPGWEDWFVSQFDFNRYHHSDAPSASDALLGLVVEHAPPAERARRGAAGPPMPMPRAPEARAVAQAILRSPGSSWRTDDCAARENISVRTLQRQFLDGTGVVFSEWRARARVSIAAEHLAQGRAVGWTGRRVGYDTPAGFTRAFRRHFGVAPRDYARRVDAGAADGAAERFDATTPLAALVGHQFREPPPIPPRQLWSLVHDCHVLWWAYRGHVEIRVGTHQHSLRQGDALWVPAGLVASVDLAARSILLPLGQRYGTVHIGPGELSAFSLPSDAERFLLHTVLTEYTLFRPAARQRGLADELFREQLVARRDDGASAALTGALAALALAMRRDPADSRSLAAWATRLRLSPRALGEELHTQTGSSFPAWRAQLRMTLARELLTFGDTPRTVAQTLGYATSAVFGKVFTTAHGISPRQYQRRVS
jgi:AraC-like DNA-binding protein